MKLKEDSEIISFFEFIGAFCLLEFCFVQCLKSISELLGKGFQMQFNYTKERKQFDEEWKKMSQGNFYIDKGVSNNVELEIEKEKYSIIPIKKNEIENISINIDCNFEYSSPLEINTELGILEVKLGNEILYSLSIKNINKIEKKDVYDYFLQLVKDHSKCFEYFRI